MHARDTPSATKHAKDLDKDAKGHPKASLIAQIGGNTIKTNVFSMFLKAPKDLQGPPLGLSRAPRDLSRAPQAAPKDPPRIPKDPQGPSQRRPESAQVHAGDTPSAPKHAKDLDKTLRGIPRPP